MQTDAGNGQASTRRSAGLIDKRLAVPKIENLDLLQHVVSTLAPLGIKNQPGLKPNSYLLLHDLLVVESTFQYIRDYH